MKYTVNESMVLDNDAALAVVDVKTNYPMGGDAGHGGRTIVKIGMDTGMLVEVPVFEDGAEGASEHICYNSYGVVFSVMGDAECRQLAKALEFATKKLKRKILDVEKSK